MKTYDVIIIGGGAAGLACASALSESHGLKILVAEAAPRAGRKLAATGNGQGNVTNTEMNISHYRSGNLAAVGSIACPQNNNWQNRIFGATLFKTDAAGRVYPKSLQASSLTDMLLRRISAAGVELRLNAAATKLEKSAAGFTVDCGEAVSSKYVVLAAGGKAQKQFFTNGSAYKLAQSLGHTVTPLRPAIVQLKTDTTHTKNLKGIRANCRVRAFVGGKQVKEAVGDVIFTDYGISGNAIFYVSSALGGEGSVSIDFLPDVSEEELAAVVAARLGEGVSPAEAFCGIVHNQIARAAMRRAGGVGGAIKILKDFTLAVTGTLGFDYAQVTQGGIDMREVTDKLESKLAPNLFFAGEILDVDGDCGGYNLNWAFSSGVFVADEIAKRLK